MLGLMCSGKPSPSCKALNSGAKSSTCISPEGKPVCFKPIKTARSRLALEPEPNASSAPCENRPSEGSNIRHSKSGLDSLRALVSLGRRTVARLFGSLVIFYRLSLIRSGKYRNKNRVHCTGSRSHCKKIGLCV